MAAPEKGKAMSPGIGGHPLGALQVEDLKPKLGFNYIFIAESHTP